MAIIKKISIWDRMANAAKGNERTNALAVERENMAEEQHMARIKKAKQKQAQMMARRRMQNKNMLATMQDYEENGT